MSLHSQSNQVAIYAFKKGYRILPNGHVVSPRNIEGKQFLNQMDIWLLVLDIKENLSVYWFTNYVLFKNMDI